MTTAGAAAVGLLLIVTLSTFLWAASVRMRDASVADVAWGPGFAVLAWLYLLLLDGAGWRPVLVAVLVTVWGLRLGAHIAARHRGRGEDPRYQAMRAMRGRAFWWKSLFVVFWLQAAILWFVALPLVVVSAGGPGHVTLPDVVGLLLFAIGFTLEAVGDAQLARFKADPANRGRVLDTGLWRYTRHPNYFGDALLWWGLFLIAVSVPGGWLTVGSPLLMTFLLVRVSGVALLERGLVRTTPGYADYVRRTSAFVPWLPARRSGGDGG